MDRVPDITERPWYTAAEPYCDPYAPERPHYDDRYDEEDENYGNTIAEYRRFI